MKQTKKSSGKKHFLPLLLLSVLFYGVMLLLTLTAKDIHLARLPQVTASRLGNVSFTYLFTPENGEPRIATKQMPGIPKELYDSGQIFTVTTKVTDEMTYYYAKKISLKVDSSKENDTHYAISDSFFRDMIILSGYENLKDGDEVNLIKEEK
ncbi:MAG: hypothetical protein J6C07_05920 [Lachnospiraceae bacterium]|nr:hypothetical protein [Lachnospiraceae bacterium]